MARDFDLLGIVPWGRRLEEYAAFFGLAARLVRGRDASRGSAILDVGAGPSSFPAEASQRGLTVVAADPLYGLGAAAIRARFEAAKPVMLQGLQRAAERFVWSFYRSPLDLERRRQEALEIFLEDYEWGRACGRYVTAALPTLPFPDRRFDLALCSHLLFLYSSELDAAFHVAALTELCRVAREVRVFPLLTLEGEPSPHLPEVLARLEERGIAAEAVPVAFEFQRGATRMLRLRRLQRLLLPTTVVDQSLTNYVASETPTTRTRECTSP